MRRQKKVVPANSRKLGFGHNSLMGFAASKQTIYIVSGSKFNSLLWGGGPNVLQEYLSFDILYSRVPNTRHGSIKLNTA